MSRIANQFYAALFGSIDDFLKRQKVTNLQVAYCSSRDDGKTLPEPSCLQFVMPNQPCKQGHLKYIIGKKNA